MTSADQHTPPDPPAAVISAITALRAAFDDLHEMHDCDQNCLQDCELSDYSESAYRRHDEHNADVREDIEERASALVNALEHWFGGDAMRDLRSPGSVGAQQQ
ncbi:Uncharacterised protein [Mycobacteroides abscessus subsp. bolletii]|uniref:hypothetical protein n=1 Tax=Mycobacteroides abscessus TaxID=36809 RepID=UPI0009A6D358|nr:hypothetical protein [Mycobacteroides abscessus]SKY96226.1 Uncharacterised protein [Mycobacteroides abscessus subsp. bolletii]